MKRKGTIEKKYLKSSIGIFFMMKKLFFYYCVLLSIHMSFCPSMCPSVHLYVLLSIHMSFCPSTFTTGLCPNVL